MAYKSKFKPKNPRKYIGKNIHNIICRSTWELGLAKYCDTNSTVIKWSLESVIIPYIDQLCVKPRRYFMDFYIETRTGQKMLVEVKPFNQTQAPNQYKKKYKELKTILNESPNMIYHPKVLKKYNSVITFAKNKDKWITARKYANEHNMDFHIWTENTLREMGIRIVTKFKKLRAKKRKPVKQKPVKQKPFKRKPFKRRRINKKTKKSL